MLAQCVCPARGDDGKDPLPTTGWGELFILLMLTSIAAVAIWEAARCFYRVGNRWMRKYRKAKRLAEVSQLASSVARREIATSSTSKALPSTPRLRRRSTEVTTQSVRATPPTASSATPTPSTPMSPLDAPPVLPPLPQFRGGSRQREVDETQEERERVAFDTLQLMFSEDLRTGCGWKDSRCRALRKIWQGDCRLLWWLRMLPTSSYAMCCSFGDQSR